MSHKCPLCARVISTTEYWHQCDPAPQHPRQSLVHKLIMATVARHKAQNADDELELAKAAWTVLRKFKPHASDPALKRALSNLERVSFKAAEEARLLTATNQPAPCRRWNDKSAIEHHPV